MNRLLPLFLILSACDFPIPDSGCAKVTKEGNIVHVENCSDAGAAGIAAGSGGAGSSGSGAGSGGAAGHNHIAGAGGSAGAAGSSGAAGMGQAGSAGHMHGGLPVALPLPEVKPGRAYPVLVSAGNRVPVRDAGAIGAARTRCYVSFENFDDAIVFPGQPGVAHLHQYSGADKVTAAGIDPSSGGSCRGGNVNLSSYWWPTLLTPTGVVQRPIYMDWYAKASHYDLNGTPKTNLPPKGLKMLAGTMLATQAAPQNTRYVYWSCGETDGGGRSAGLPTNCSDPIIGAHVHFPQCADGRTDSPDHRAHLSYPVSGACPSTHPILLPSISFHWYYRNVPVGSKLSCDSATMAGGYCLHADEIFGWREDIFQSMLDACVNKGLSCGSDLTGAGTSMDSWGGN